MPVSVMAQESMALDALRTYHALEGSILAAQQALGRVEDLGCKVVEALGSDPWQTRAATVQCEAGRGSAREAAGPPPAPQAASAAGSAPQQHSPATGPSADEVVPEVDSGGSEDRPTAPATRVAEHTPADDELPLAKRRQLLKKMARPEAAQRAPRPAAPVPAKPSAAGGTPPTRLRAVPAAPVEHTGVFIVVGSDSSSPSEPSSGSSSSSDEASGPSEASDFEEEAPSSQQAGPGASALPSIGEAAQAKAALEQHPDEQQQAERLSRVEAPRLPNKKQQHHHQHPTQGEVYKGAQGQEEEREDSPDVVVLSYTPAPAPSGQAAAGGLPDGAACASRPAARRAAKRRHASPATAPPQRGRPRGTVAAPQPAQVTHGRSASPAFHDLAVAREFAQHFIKPKRGSAPRSVAQVAKEVLQQTLPKPSHVQQEKSKQAWQAAAMAWRQKNMPSGGPAAASASAAQPPPPAPRQASRLATPAQRAHAAREPWPAASGAGHGGSAGGGSPPELRAMYRVEAQARAAAARDFCQVLRAFGVPCDPGRLREGYRAAVRRYHPDSNSAQRAWAGAEEKEVQQVQAEEIMKIINERKPEHL